MDGSGRITYMRCVGRYAERRRGMTRESSTSQTGDVMPARFEYKVVELREGLVGGKMSGDKLEKALNENAAKGWQLKAVTSVNVKGRLGPGGVDGVLVTFERALE